MEHYPNCHQNARSTAAHGKAQPAEPCSLAYKNVSWSSAEKSEGVQPHQKRPQGKARKCNPVRQVVAADISDHVGLIPEEGANVTPSQSMHFVLYSLVSMLTAPVHRWTASNQRLGNGPRKLVLL